MIIMISAKDYLMRHNRVRKEKNALNQKLLIVTNF